MLTASTELKENMKNSVFYESNQFWANGVIVMRT